MTPDDRQLTQATSTSTLTSERQTFSCLNNKLKNHDLDHGYIFDDPNRNLDLDFPQNEICVFLEKNNLYLEISQWNLSFKGVFLQPEIFDVQAQNEKLCTT